MLATGADLEAAVRRAKAFIQSAIEHGAKNPVGKGNGPVDHLYAIRQQGAPV
jgi:hydroxymethylpyrimidine/phosphomethylpyrimidine kinase